MTLAILAVLGVIVVVALIYVVSIYNDLVNLRNETQRAWGNVDVLLKQRYDEIPKLVSTVEAFAQYEGETLREITAARTQYGQAQSVEQKQEVDRLFSSSLGRLMAVVENYPELKANQNFQSLMERVSRIENDIADRREFYNSAVTLFNTKIEQIPDVFIAQFLRYRRQPIYKIATTDTRDPKIDIQWRAGQKG